MRAFRERGQGMTVPVGIIMGSQSDWATMKEAAAVLDELGVAYETRIVSAHRTPDRLWDYGRSAVDRGLRAVSYTHLTLPTNREV